jgi:DNA-binding transcriptional regulator GbsR (MarR family)
MTTITLNPLIHQVVLLAGELAEMFSFNRSIGQIFGYLYMNAEPVSLEEIAASCRMSKANASLHLRTLEHWGAVTRSWKPGTRKDYYQAAADLRTVIARRLQDGIGKRLEFTRKRVDSIKADPSFQHALKDGHGAHWEKRFHEAEKLIGEVESGFALLPKLLKMKKFLS